GALLESSSRTRLHNGLLEIDHSNLSDRGTYTCEASSAVGSVTKTINLSLSGNLSLTVT
ncbi:hypothetical protein BIW11_03044, partial [Tropilaelaps mercedesae]